MGGVRNGKSAGTPEPAVARQDALRAGMPDVRPEEAARDAVDRHLRSAAGLLREGSAARAFGQLARASHTEPMTPRLAAALVRFALLAGTEAAAITLLDAAREAAPEVRRAVRRQLARVLRRVGQVPRAIAALEAVLAEVPEDRRARRVLQVLREREARAAAGAPAAGGEVLGKLPTRKAGVQAPAVWDEDSGYREKTQVDASEAEAVPREKTAVAFPTEPPPAPSVPWSVAVPGRERDAAEAGARTRTETELPVAGVPVSPAPPESRSKTEVELPAVAVTAPEASPAEARKTEAAQPPGRAAVEPPPPESRPTVLEMPAVGLPSTEPAASSGSVAGKPPSPEPGPASRPQAPSVPWPEPSPEDEEDPLARDGRARAWADDETTGEVTSEAPPRLGAEAPREPPSRAKPPRGAAASPERAEPARAPATSTAGTPASPVDTQEVSMADLEAALSGAASASSAASGRAPPARADGPRTEAVDAQPPGAPRAPRTEASPSTRAEDLEELVRSQKLEAQLIARQAWRELAQLYLKRADRAKDATVRAEALTRLAEVMENELHDAAGAARMYREIVELTGDRAALREQVRLLSTRGDASLVRRALDEAIQKARTARARAGALLTRGERWLHMGEPGKARSDFEAAEALTPGMLPVLAGLLRCVSDAERPAIAERLRVALAAAPRRAQDRLEGLRLLAQAAEESRGDLRMAQWAWTEVLAESPDSEQARTQLVALARKLGDPKALGQLLRAQLAREARGPAARQARLELVASLGTLGDEEGALNELRQAVRYEPGHKEAWLLLVDRLTARGNLGEAAWALEHAATATEDEVEREQTWERLARLWRDVLRNPERAQVYARRAESLRQAREERELPPPEPPRSATPRREPSGPKSPLVPAPSALSLTPSAVEALANEVTSNTDVGEVPAASEAPAPSKGAEVAPKASARAKAKAERAPSSKKGAQSKDAAPSARAVEPSAKPRSPASRKDKGAAPPRAAPPVPDEEPSVAASRAPRPSASPQGSEPPSRAAKAMDLMTNEPMDLGSAPVSDTRVISWEAPPGRMDPVRRIVRSRPEGTVSVAAPAPARPSPAKPAPEPAPRSGPGAAETREAPAVSEPSQDTEPNFFRHLRERPLDPKPYRESAEYFDSRKDTGRASLMREIADALEGRESPAPQRPQRPPLTSEERAGLRHPGLRTPSGELLACSGLALCRLFPAQGRAASTSEPLRATSGPGAPAVLDALHAAARMLDVHLPELVLAEDEGPPFTAVHVGQPRLLVGRPVLQQPPPAAELRFHAGRALLSLSPDLLALRALKGGQLLRALALLTTILKDPRASSPEARLVRESLSPRALERAVALLEPGTRDFNASALADAARDSANRAGLVACGGVGPALAVLRARHNPEAELVELLRFAASERYLELRAPR